MISEIEPKLVDGKKFYDDRGSLLFVNELVLNNYKRFYVVENHSKGFIRAWHGHLKEAKVFLAIEGSFLVGAVHITDPHNPSRETKVLRTVLNSDAPQALLIPPGYANGLMSLSESAKLLVLSSSSLEESQGDDYRFPYNYWDIWAIENR